MFKEIISNIALAEKEAEAIEREALKTAQETGVKAHNKADERIEAGEREIKAEIKRIMAEASAEGETKAALMIKESGGEAGRAEAAAKRNHNEAVDRIIREFLNGSSI